jgi:hypothetical protein
MHAGEPLKKGYLTKQGAIVRSWRKRFFILSSEGDLYYLENEEAGIPKGVIKGTAINEIADSKDFGFTIKTEGRDYLIKATSAEDKASWIEAITNAKQGGGKKKEAVMVPPSARPACPDISRWQMWTPAEVGQWCASFGLPDYTPQFERANVHGSLLQSITAHQLEAVVRIEVEEHRWKILGHVQDLVVSNLQYGTPMPDGGFLG